MGGKFSGKEVPMRGEAEKGKQVELIEIPREDNKLKLIYTNANCLRNKMTELFVLVSECDPDIICVTETHCNSDYYDSELSIPNYCIFRTDRNANGGGSIIYAKNWLLAVRLESFAVDDCVGIEFESLNRKIYCVCVYRSTALSDAQNNLLLTELNKLPINDESELIIVGDFNLPDVNWFSGNLKVCSDTTDRNLLNQLKFMDLFVQKGLTWHIKDQITSRRLVNGCLQESTLDQLLTSNEHMIEKLELSAPLGRSDHLVMNATFTLANNMQYAATSKRIW